MEGKRVLVVDDDAVLQGILVKEFEHAGFAALGARNASEAQAAYEREKPDGMVLDVLMPGMTGLEFLSQLRAKYPQDRMPVLILSDSDDVLNVEQAIRDDAVAYLLKSDHDPAEIVRTMAEKLSSAPGSREETR
jgi:CheY-like chemotaxis protein